MSSTSALKDKLSTVHEAASRSAARRTEMKLQNNI